MDKKNFSEDKKRLLQRLASSDPEGKNMKNRLRVMFFARKDEIVEAHNAGWSLRQIWEELHKQLEFTGSYDAFVRLYRINVKTRHSELHDKSLQAILQTEQRSDNIGSDLRTAPQNNLSGATAQQGFSYDPNIDPSNLY